MNSVSEARAGPIVRLRICHTKHEKQDGVGLMEVLFALIILTFGALAIVNLQITSSVAISSSADHFKINELGQGIVEHLKSDSSRAIAGNYNTEFAENEASASIPADIAEKINGWKQATSRTVPFGQTQINCNSSECNIGFKWYEHSHSGQTDQVFNFKSPI